MGALQLSTILNVSLSSTPAGVSAFNTSNLAILTLDTAGGGFGSNGYKIYYDPTSVGVDFGTSSATYLCALNVFSQAPNILAGGGYLVVVQMQTGSPNETVGACITRTLGLVAYFGVITTTILSQADLEAAAAVIQAQNMMGFFAGDASADVQTGGKLDLLRSGTNTQTRGLYYGDTSGSPAGINAVTYAAAYAGRALSTNFNGSNTTQTMNLKQLANVQPDPTMSPSNYNAALAAGADMYVSLASVSATLTSGTNKFFDQVYNALWLVGAIQVAGFNFMLQTSGKIPQTEDGMDGLKGAYRKVLEQAVTNGYAAPGTWTSPTTFGNQLDLIANVAQRGYYMYSVPLSQQLQSARAARQAPLVQMALKESGAFHTGTVVLNVNP